MKSFCQYMGCSYEFDGKYHFNSDIRSFIYHITYYSLMFFIVYAFKGQVHVFAGQVKIVSHSSCRTSAILKYFCPLYSTDIFFLTGKLLGVYLWTCKPGLSVAIFSRTDPRSSGEGD